MKIQFNVLESLVGFVCKTLLRIGSEPLISISRADPMVGLGELMHVCFTPPSESTFNEIREWLEKLESVGQVYNIEATKEVAGGQLGFGVV